MSGIFNDDSVVERNLLRCRGPVDELDQEQLTSRGDQVSASQIQRPGGKAKPDTYKTVYEDDKCAKCCHQVGVIMCIYLLNNNSKIKM